MATFGGAADDIAKKVKQVQAAVSAVFDQSGLKGTAVAAQDRVLLIVTGTERTSKKDALLQRARDLISKIGANIDIQDLASVQDLSPEEIRQRNALIMESVKAIVGKFEISATLVDTRPKPKVFLISDETSRTNDQLKALLKELTDAWSDTFEVVFSNGVLPGLPDSPKTLVAQWQLHNIRNDTTFDGLIRPAEFVDGLNFILGKFHKTDAGPVQDPFANFKGNTVWLRGTGRQVDGARALLGLFDTRSPAVNATAWAFQIAGSPESVRKTSIVAEDEIKQSRLSSAFLIGLIKSEMANLEKDPSNRDPLVGIFDEAGFDTDLDKSLSTLQILIRLGAHKKRDLILQNVDKTLAALRASKEMGPRERIAKALGTGVDGRSFPNVYTLLKKKDDDDAQLSSDRKSVIEFLIRAVYFDKFVDVASKQESGVSGADQFEENPDLRNAPENLQHASDAVDRHLDHLTTALADDLELMVVRPMLERIRAADKKGTSLNGRVSILVSSGRSAGVTSELVSYQQTQIARSLDDSLFKAIAPPGNKGSSGKEVVTEIDAEGKTTTKTTETGGSEIDTNSLSPLSRLLSGMPLGQAALLGGLLSGSSDERFVKVAPGVSIAITPVVGPDHLNADVKIETVFGIETTLQKTGDSDEGKYPLPDAVKSHRVQTVAPISGFGLTGLSSLNMQTTVPRPAAVIPILGQIPLFGPMFRFPQPPAKTMYQSQILVSSTVTPRILGLFNYYGNGGITRRLQFHAGATNSSGNKSKPEEDYTKILERLTKIN